MPFGIPMAFETEGVLMVAADSGDDATSRTARPQGQRLGLGAIASITGVGLLLIFILQNRETVELHFLFWTFDWPLWLLILASALLGALAWFGLGMLRRHQRRKARRDNRGD